MQNRRSLPTILLVLMITLGCVVPGLPTVSDATPVAQACQLETMVAEMVDAAIAQTEQAAPPPVEPPVAATELPAATPQMDLAGSLTPQNDGTILFKDGAARYELNVSPGWLPVRLNQQEYYDAFSLPAAADPAAQRALSDIATLNPQSFRLFIFDLQDGHLVNRVVSRISLEWDPEASLVLSDETGIQAVADSLPGSTPGLTVTDTSVIQSTNGLALGVILSEFPGKNFDEADVVLYQKQVHLNLPLGTLAITFTTETSFKDATLPFFDAMVDTLKVESGQ